MPDFAHLDRDLEADLETRFVRAIQGRFPLAKIRKGHWEGRRGAFDRAVLLPGPVIAFAEVKNGTKGRLSGPQRAELADLTYMGFIAHVIRCNDDILPFIEALEAVIPASWPVRPR